MKQSFNLENFSMLRGSIKEISPNKVVMECPEGVAGRFMATVKPGSAGDIDWQDAKYLVADITSFMDWSVVFMFEFWEEGNEEEQPNVTVRMSTIPNVKTRLVLPLDALDAQNIFLPRTPGKLRSFVHGKRTDIAKVNRFALGVREGWEKQNLEISDVYITDTEPAYPLPDVKLVDSLGQLKKRHWIGKTNCEDDVKKYLKNQLEISGEAAYPDNWSSYGGWKNKKMDAKGYFSLQNDGRRWWLVDPDGYVFFTTGMDCIYPGGVGPVKSIAKFFDWIPAEDGKYEDAWMPFRFGNSRFDDEQFSYAVANLIRTFGDGWRDAWTKITRANLTRWGMNTIGAFSDPEFIKNSNMPYLLPLMWFPSTKKLIVRDFPDVFSDEYKTNAKEYAQQIKPYADDKNMIGYFLRNEPHWAFTANLEVAEELLANPDDFISKDVMIEFFADRYDGDIDEFNKAWGLSLAGFDDLKKPIAKAASLSEVSAKDLSDFSYLLIKEYVKVPSLAVKEVDPNHLNLGMRYAFILYDNQLAGKEYLDVFSINCYKIDPSNVLEHTIECAGMPVMIGEFHFGALDVGMEATGIIGVASQADRGKAYRCYIEHAASFPECVGIQYFQLNDQPGLGRADGENYQIGFVDVCQKPYEQLIKEASAANFGIYEVADGIKEPKKVDPKKITSNITS